MEYIIYIDESGSISSSKNYNLPFLVCLVLLKAEHKEKIKKKVKEKINSIKLKIGISRKNELKATDLNKNNWKKEEHQKFCTYFQNSDKTKIYGAYLWSGTHLKNTKWIKNKNITFNFMVNLALERILENEDINSEDTIKFMIDNRNVGVGSLKSLEDYLISKYVLEKNLLSGISVNYHESHLHWGIQLVDLICNGSWKCIIEGEKQNKMRELKI